MELIVQDPLSPIDNANSYQSLYDARALADTYGYDLPEDDAECIKSLVKAMRYIELKEGNMSGERVGDAQNTAYPRKHVVIRGTDFPEDQFPRELLLSQVVGAHYHSTGTDLTGGTDDGKSISQESLTGVGSVSYFDNGKTGEAVSIPEFDMTIRPLMCYTSSISIPIVAG